MASSSPHRFKVTPSPGVTRETKRLGKRASRVGALSAFKADFLEIVGRLESDADTWGEPEYHPKKSGSTLRCGAYGMLVIRYVVYLIEQEALIVQLLPAPNSPIAE